MSARAKQSLETLRAHVEDATRRNCAAELSLHRAHGCLDGANAARDLLVRHYELFGSDDAPALVAFTALCTTYRKDLEVAMRKSRQSYDRRTAALLKLRLAQGERQPAEEP